MTVFTICLFSQPSSCRFRILSSRTVHDGLKNQELNSSDSGIDHRGQANKGKILYEFTCSTLLGEGRGGKGLEIFIPWWFVELQKWMKQTKACSYLCSAIHICIKPENQIFTPEHCPSSRGYMELNVWCDPCRWPFLLSPVMFDNVGEAGVLYLWSGVVGFWLWEADLSGFYVNFIMVVNKSNSNSKLLCVPDGKI